MSDAENGFRKAIAAEQANTAMYVDAWRRELGAHIAPKHHLIDALVLGTRTVVAEVKAATATNQGVAKWKADAAVARTLGVPEPSILNYLPTAEEAP